MSFFVLFFFVRSSFPEYQGLLLQQNDRQGLVQLVEITGPPLQQHRNGNIRSSGLHMFQQAVGQAQFPGKGKKKGKDEGSDEEARLAERTFFGSRPSSWKCSNVMSRWSMVRCATETVYVLMP